MPTRYEIELPELVSSTKLTILILIFRACNIWDSSNPISYLVGITTPRTQSIRSITCDWNICGKPNGAHLLALLGACQGLRVGMEISTAKYK